MKKGFLIALVIFSALFTGCGKTKDLDNKNVTKTVDTVDISNVNIYYDMSLEMGEFLQYDLYREMAYAAGSSAKDTFFNAEAHSFAIRDDIIELKGENSEVNAILNTVENYSGETEALKTTLDKVTDESVTILITDLHGQLFEYSDLSRTIVEKVLKKGQAVGFIGIDFDDKSLFVIAISDNENLSKYIKAFKSNPSVAKFEKTDMPYQTDTIEKINYQIIANESGINGIKYAEIQYVENGVFLNKNNNQITQETKGSFTKINLDYKPMEFDDIEGTVNFTNNTPQLATCDNNYIGLSSLLYGVERDNIGGKIKLAIPVDVIEGVKLSKLNCDIDTEIYYAKKNGKFKPVKYDNMKISLAKGFLPEHGRWSIDDETNSMIFNIIFENACDFPSDGGAFKIDVKFSQYDSIESVSQWVKDWDKDKVYNLMNFFNSIYSYQAEANKAENELTIYVGSGNKTLYKRAMLAAGIK